MNAKGNDGGRHSLEKMLPSPRILIVDDNLAHASAVKRALRDQSSIFGRLGCEIDVVEDLASARQYLRDDSIDIYFLDLEISEKAGEGLLDPSVGRAFVSDVVRTTNAGVVVCSSLSHETEAATLLEAGADDYVEKTSSPDVIAARALSVWRRTLQSRPEASQALRLAHVGRTFILSGWHFVVGNRTLINSEGSSIKISPTEHAFLRYLAAVDGHMINSEIFNIDVLDRDQHKVHVRLDNFVHRLRKKLGGELEIIPHGKGFYKLLDIREIKPTVPT
jgi:two-component system response regulator TctD